MHRLAYKFGIALVALLAFLGIDYMITPGTVSALMPSVPIVGQVVAFVISGAVAFVVLVAGWSVTGFKQLAK